MTPRLTPGPDAEDLRTVVRDVLDRHVVPSADPAQGWSPTGWSRLVSEVGAVGLDVPEAHGGAGASFREVAVVAEELGRSVVRLPWFSTAVLGVGVLLHARGCDGPREELLDRILSGRASAGLAYREDLAASPALLPATRAVLDGDGWRLQGTKTLVVEGATADVLFVSATTGEGPRIFAVEADAPGVVRTPMQTLDPTRQLAEIVLDRAPGTPVCVPGESGRLLDAVLHRARAALACEQAGGAAAAMTMAVDHAAQRLQFGRPIATFQAIKHRCADMAVRVEAARSASLWASAAVAEDAADLASATATAVLVCGPAYAWVAAENVQVHGGIGFTWEHRAHLHVRRAAAGSVLVADADTHQEQLLADLGV